MAITHTVLPDISGLSGGIKSASGALANVLEQRADRRLNSALSNVLSQADFTTQEGQQDALSKMIGLKVPAKDALGFLQSANDFRKGQSAASLSPFQKKMQEKSADFLMSGLEEGPKAASSRENIDRLRDLSKELEGPVGYGKALINSADAAEFNERGLLALEPVIKIFNPRGVIPQRKIEMLKEKFAPKATDNRLTIEGKLKGLEALVKQSEEHSNMIKDLYNQYGENIPMEAIINYEANSEKIIDSVLSTKTEGDRTTEDDSFEKPPSAKKNKGVIIENEETGESLISNGTRWIKYRG